MFSIHGVGQDCSRKILEYVRLMLFGASNNPQILNFTQCLDKGLDRGLHSGRAWTGKIAQGQKNLHWSSTLGIHNVRQLTGGYHSSSRVDNTSILNRNLHSCTYTHTQGHTELKIKK